MNITYTPQNIEQEVKRFEDRIRETCDGLLSRVDFREAYDHLHRRLFVVSLVNTWRNGTMDINVTPDESAIDVGNRAHKAAGELIQTSGG